MPDPSPSDRLNPSATVPEIKIDSTDILDPAAEPHRAHGPKRGVGMAGDIAASVSKGLEALTCGHRNPVSEIVGIVCIGRAQAWGWRNTEQAPAQN